MYFEVTAWVQPTLVTYSIFWGGRNVSNGSSTMQFSLPLQVKSEGRFTNWHGKIGVSQRGGPGDCLLFKV